MKYLVALFVVFTLYGIAFGFYGGAMFSAIMAGLTFFAARQMARFDAVAQRPTMEVSTQEKLDQQCSECTKTEI